MGAPEQKALTLRELRDALNALTDEQLDRDAIWWGDERGGKLTGIKGLEEEYITLDSRDGMSPRSTYDEEGDYTEDEIEARMPKGQVVLLSDK